MDIKSFLKYVYRYKWVVVIVPIIAVSITYYLVKNLPNQYSSEVQIATGLLDPSKQVISDQNVDFFKVNQQFNSIMEKLKLKKIINILSYSLILHDLENPKSSFRKYSVYVDSLNRQDREEVISLFKEKLMNKSVLTLSDNKGKYKLYDIVGSMGYGEEGFKKDIEITHADNSDFINIKYISENPDLSAYVVNRLATEFITYYSADVNYNQNNSIVLLDSLLKRKELVMNAKNDALSNFKRTKGVLNLESQSGAVYAQISQNEAQRADAIKLIQSNLGAIATIDNKLRGGDPIFSGSSRSDNMEIINLKRQLEIANNKWVDGGFKPSDQKKIDSLNRIISAKGIQNADENVLDPKTSKQGLIQQKLSLEIAIQQAKSSLSSLDAELRSLRNKYSSMVPYDADIQNFQREADLATKDYMAALDRYNGTRTEQNMGLRLQIDQMGLPGNAEPSKTSLYLAGAGFTGFMLSIGCLFLFFITNQSITTGAQLELATKSNTIGVLNRITSDERNMRNIWDDKEENKNYEIFRDLLRSFRFEISGGMEVDNSKILGITSLTTGVGKTFVAYSLAYAFAMTGKKVLLIADELPVVKPDTKGLTTGQNFQTFLIKREIHTEDLITIMNKNIARNSLLELQSIKTLKAGFEVLREEFDLIIIDVNSLHDINLAKEWLLFTEKNIAVFQSGMSIRDTDKQFVNYIKKQPGFLGWVLNKVEIASKAS
jgi:succinoglycan biosynthesis transport protein ExoP